MGSFEDYLFNGLVYMKSISDEMIPIKGIKTLKIGEENMEQKKTTGNEIIDLLMKKLGVEVDEEFEIIESIYNPYKITEKGYLIDCDGDERTETLVELILGQRTIKKIPKPEIKEMTISELEEALKLPKGTLRVKGDE